MTKTYLGQKGYSILKKKLTVNDQIFIREELSIQPNVPHFIKVKPEPFPIYRESNNKLYVPRFFGLKHYGVPDEIKVNKFKTSNNLEFKGSLRDYQIDIVSKYIEHVNNDDNLHGGLLEIPCGRGKTVMALNIASKLKVKTLVIVHKGFLLEQWIERINQFLPDAKIGRIQGQIIDIEDKDIVIGMLQSLSMKDYPTSLFSSFGLTIVDEVHHIAAEVFVRSLFTVVTKYVLGLSATMQRKDGLTKVFKMFLGDIVYKEKQNSNLNVLVNLHYFDTNDDEFKEDVLDYRGQVQYSSMITKLCKCNARSDFILDIIKHQLSINNNQQILVLALYKNLLTYFYKHIQHYNVATVGYYVGGMKPEKLKESEGKKIILATYAMAAEALDIKTLTTLVMATPKTDVTQSIGRILRVKDNNPLVIDIIDYHTIFQNQAKKRLAYYHKQNYIVHQYTDKHSFKIISKNKKEKKSKKKEHKCLIQL